ncbi:MAG: DUF1905 domain-containing protein [Pyrinomonadaceae bacterium]
MRKNRSVPVQNDEDGESAGLAHLIRVDPDLRRIHRDLGPPPLWPREPGFATLIQIILEQQVSLASARAAFDRLALAIDPITPQGFLQLTDAALLKIGFSRQKTVYCRYLSEAILQGELDLEALSIERDDVAVRSALTRVKGIGNWTADIYLLMALRRPDVWPIGDLALAVALLEVKRLTERPGPEEMERLAIKWRPYRALAARLLWHHYLSVPRRPATPVKPDPAMKRERFTAVILDGHKESACEVPFDPAERWLVQPQQLRPGRRGYPVRGTINGIKFRSTIIGRSRKFYLLIGDELKQTANVNSGDQVKLVIEPDV